MGELENRTVLCRTGHGGGRVVWCCRRSPGRGVKVKRLEIKPILSKPTSGKLFGSALQAFFLSWFDVMGCDGMG